MSMVDLVNEKSKKLGPLARICSRTNTCGQAFMNLAAKREQLTRIYETFEAKMDPLTQEAVCVPGCAYCCTHFGTVDITTLEGLLIQEKLARLPRPIKIRLGKAIAQNRRRKQLGQTAVCPFLDKKKRCRIYEVRPFSCRQLYSVRPCGDEGPQLHRKAVSVARETIAALQRLDDTGYSGHLSYILDLLELPGFKDFYLGGKFDPGSIQEYGRTHGLVINRMVSPSAGE